MAFAAGRPVTAAQMERIANPPRAQMRQTVSQSIGSGAFTAISLDTEEFDSANGHSNVTNNTRYTAQIAGKYLVTGKVSFVSNSNGGRGCRIHKNGAVVPGSEQVMSVGAAGIVFSIACTPVYVELAVGDYVEVCAWQNTGGNLSTSVADASQQSVMGVMLVRDNAL